ncbi:hypothetical protein [Armatimonas rosea]|uniref:Uncharacterized protein n=1 Tax=Armatimonas rosea TaxID=685828 RepID=A0A7W9SVC4_ARMRO|nr:hypothetical protein [Armatimonas rosea]MBB6053527.1 hypothetical protein [Armatimonas rosea]
MSHAKGFRVSPAPTDDGVRLGNLRTKVQWLHLVALIIGVGALVFLAFAFWGITEGIAMALGHKQGLGPLLPLILATLGSWSIMYLLHDKLGILGSATAREALLPRARSLAGKEPTLARHFVEVRPVARRGAFQPDWGWLLIFPDRLEFAGERQQLTIPRPEVGGMPEREGTAGGLLPLWLNLPVRDKGTSMALLCRDSARSLSDTQRDGEALEASLRAWLQRLPDSEPAS